MKRPLGVSIIAWLAIVAGAIEALISFGYLGFSQLLIPGFTLGSLAAYGALLVGSVGVALLVLGIVGIVFGIGALGLRSWAWMTGVILYGLNALLAVVTWFMTGFVGVTLFSVVGVVISVAIVAYLYTADAREAFGRVHHGMDSSHTTHATPA